MTRSVLRVFVLLSVVCLTNEQSTSANRRCVYTFNVRENECSQTPGSGVDDQLFQSHVIALQTQFKMMVDAMTALRKDNERLVNVTTTLENDMKAVQERNDRLEDELKRERTNTDTGTANQRSSTGGAVYTRWGRKSCPDNGTNLVYSGLAAGSWFDHFGGASNYLCMHADPQWGPKTTTGLQSNSRLYGAEYETQSNDPFSKANEQSLLNNNVPCAVCLVTRRPTKLMIPARLSCPAGWTKEYSGYLMAGAHVHKGRTTYVCVDNAPEVMDGGVADQNGALFYNTEAVCGSLPCPKYGDGWELTCVVCTR